MVEQMRSFTEASVIVSTHGPSLGYLVFARPRTLAVEVTFLLAVHIHSASIFKRLVGLVTSSHSHLSVHLICPACCS